MKKGITHVEIIVAFSIFILGLSTILYFFIPFFNPTYYSSLNTLEKNFEKKFSIETSLIKFVVNETGSITFIKHPNMSETNSLIFNKDFEPIDFSIQDNNITANVNENELFLLISNEEINNRSQLTIENPKPSNVYYSFPIKEIFINVSKFEQDYNYEDLKREMGIVSNFNITLIDESNFYSIGKPIPKINVFAKEKLYKIIKDKKIKYVKVRFYVW